MTNGYQLLISVYQTLHLINDRCIQKVCKASCTIFCIENLCFIFNLFVCLSCLRNCLTTFLQVDERMNVC